MQYNHLQILALLAIGQGVAAQRDGPNNPGHLNSTSSHINESVTFIQTGEPSPTFPHSAHNQTGTFTPTSTHPSGPSQTSSAGGYGTNLTTTSSAGPVPTVGVEYVDFASVSTLNGAKRQVAVVTVPVSRAVCPIFAVQVPDYPCYPCAVGYPEIGQTLVVYTTSVVNAAPDPTPVFDYQFCEDCPDIAVTTPVPGYTPGSRNFGGCFVYPAESTNNPLPPRPTGRPDDRPRPRPTGGITTTAYVTASITYTLEIITTCAPTNGGVAVVSTVYQESTTCATYQSVVVIPASLCVTAVSTKPDGVVTTVVTPVSTWTVILTTQVTSTATATATAGAVGAATMATGAPAGYTPVKTAVSSAGAVGAVPTKYVQSGAGRLAVGSFVAVGVSFVAVGVSFVALLVLL